MAASRCRCDMLLRVTSDFYEVNGSCEGYSSNWGFLKHISGFVESWWSSCRRFDDTSHWTNRVQGKHR
jgi:hypothetical protein